MHTGSAVPGTILEEGTMETLYMIKCAVCNAHCCRHVAIHIDTPTTKAEHDTIRWYLLHENVYISIDHDNNWILEFKTPCREITSDFKCGDYRNRPAICRDYPSSEEYCEGETTDVAYTHLFKSVEDFEEYLEEKKRV